MEFEKKENQAPKKIRQIVDIDLKDRAVVVGKTTYSGQVSVPDDIADLIKIELAKPIVKTLDLGKCIININHQKYTGVVPFVIGMPLPETFKEGVAIVAKTQKQVDALYEELNFRFHNWLDSRKRVHQNKGIMNFDEETGKPIGPHVKIDGSSYEAKYRAMLENERQAKA